MGSCFVSVIEAQSAIPVGGLRCWRGIAGLPYGGLKRPVSRELMCFHRREQMKKLRAILGAVLRFKKVDSFRVATAQIAEQC